MAGWQGRVIQLWKSFEKPEVIFWVKSSLSFFAFHSCSHNSHELVNPLASVKVYLCALKEGKEVNAYNIKY